MMTGRQAETVLMQIRDKYAMLFLHCSVKIRTNLSFSAAFPSLKRKTIEIEITVKHLWIFYAILVLHIYRMAKMVIFMARW